MSFSTDFKKRILVNYFITDRVYLALFKGDPTDEDNEVDASDYSREEITFADPMESGDKVILENDDVVEFDYAESDWGTITHVAIFDDSEGGNLLDYAEINNEALVTEDTQFWIDEGGYQIEWGDN